MTKVEEFLDAHMTSRDINCRTLEMQIPYLLAQHCQEILFVKKDYRDIVTTSFSTEFLEMLHTCIFIPCIHDKTPKPFNLPKTDPAILNDKKLCWLPSPETLEDFFELLTKITIC